ncbi:hypothetical protein IFM89_011287 [Coptis chinensis]|uniref:X8 domain-containing protein n=1 Tax=Coptis chinensis TaxID=261450 RepID=A0A835HS89_9MAGN|nr:hypothetical protein IFM89_011287 [Coptis chinensis]
MAHTHYSQALISLITLTLISRPPLQMVESAIGVNWGSVSYHRLSPSIVVDLLKHNKIQKVKLFDADPGALRALMGSGIQVMVGIPNEMLSVLSSSSVASDLWVRQNVSSYVGKYGADISKFRSKEEEKEVSSDLVSLDDYEECRRYIAVGNEPFLTSYSGQYQSYVVPALLNLQQSLAKANLVGYVKLVVPCNADVYESSLPSQGTFRPELTDVITQLVSFLNSNGSPFVVNIYPFLNLYQNTDFPEDYAFFEGTSHSVTDGQNIYSNAFDGNLDTLVAALSKLGYGQISIVIGEVGWPTDGAPNANLTAARAFNQGLINHVLSNKGTPLRPGVPPMDVYLFGLLDEGAKSTLPGNFERHWGIFSFDGQAKYQLNLGLGNGLLKNAKDVQYLPSRWCIANPYSDLSGGMTNHLNIACSAADCTTLNYGGSCNAIGAKGNISYAFNSYYQMQKQNSRSCEFDGLGLITFLNPSIGQCRFLVGISDNISSSVVSHTSFWVLSLRDYKIQIINLDVMSGVITQGLNVAYNDSVMIERKKDDDGNEKEEGFLSGEDGFETLYEKDETTDGVLGGIEFEFKEMPVGGAALDLVGVPLPD